MADAYRVTREKVTFTNGHGETLAGLLERPEETPKAYALFAHCFTCSKNVGAASRISRALAAQGFAVLRFDFTGLGNSEGDFANTNFSSNVSDLAYAARHMAASHGPVELLIGHSLGGAAVLAAAGDLPEAKAVVTIGAPSDPGHIEHLLRDHLDGIEADGEAVVDLAGRRFTIKKQFLKDIRGRPLGQRVATLRKALLVMHSPVDDIVGVDEASKIFLAAKHPKSFVSLDRADHLLNDPRDAQFVADVVAAWAGRYVLAAAGETASERPALNPGEVLVRDIGDGLTNEVFSGVHRLWADEPVVGGGADRGPDPYKYLLAALGACTSMTLRLYARHKKLALRRVTVKLRHEKIHAEDCRDCETKIGKLDRIEREIIVEGDFDDDQRRRLLEIADRCPVHRTLKSEIHIVSRLAE
jgi:putative redox protein